MPEDLKFSFDRPVLANDFCVLADQTDWARGRRKTEIESVLKGCYAVLGVWIEDRLVGVARIISDGVYNAQVLDVIVDEAHRGRGTGSSMMRQIMDRCSNIEVVSLNCGPREVPFYVRIGFKPGQRMSLRPGRDN